MEGNTTFESWQQSIAREDQQFDNDDLQYLYMTRDTYTNLKKEIQFMPLPEVQTLPEDVQRWIFDVRPDLKREEQSSAVTQNQGVSKRAQMQQELYQETPPQKQEIDLARDLKRRDHWDSLALLTKELKDSTYVPDLYGIWREEPTHIDKAADGLQALVSLRAESLEYIRANSEADYTLYPYLIEHLQAESNWTHGMSSLRAAVVTFSRELHSLVTRIKEEAQSKTKLSFSTEAPGLDSYLDSYFAQSVYKSSLSVLADYEVRGTTLFYNGRPIAEIPESNLRDKVKAVHKELCQEVKDFPELKNVKDAHSKLEKAFDPVRKILEQVALRGTFDKGKCLICP
jgi:hypothetical protein